MPPNVETIATLMAKRDITIASLDKLFGEFDMLFQGKSELTALENVRAESRLNSEV